MSVTLKELRDIIKNTPGVANTDAGLDAAIAAVLNRLASLMETPHDRDVLRSIAHPPASKREPDVEAAIAELRQLKSCLLVGHVTHSVDAALRALGEDV